MNKLAIKKSIASIVLIALLACTIFAQKPITFEQHNHGVFEKILGDGDHEFICYNRVHRNFYLVIFIITIALSIIIYSRYRIKRKLNVELLKKNKLIENINKEITDSINYAKIIQQAQLPDKKEFSTVLPNSFILFKPKDIVSGDFYYFHKDENKIIIASADCTGHGVPGAFMSILGAEKLNDALQRSSDTSEILSYLNKMIKSSLKQSEDKESTRDGMDIAICAIDLKSRIVKYAGANRPIWIIRKGQTKVEEIKATKKAIGGYTDANQYFESHEINFEEGDTFYLHTDGFADTFGGVNQKKLTTKVFKELLISIQNKTLKEQGLHLDKFIESWKNGLGQIDDILVVGFQL